MFKEIKAEARKTLFQNYKFLIIPSLLFMVSNFTNKIILNYFTSLFWWSDLTDFSRLVALLSFVFFEFVMVPFSLALLYKSIILVTKSLTNSKEHLRSFINLSNAKRIILINFLPRLTASFLDVNGSKISAFNIFKIDGLPLILLSIVAFFISYKFYACNYYFALTEASVKQTISASFKIMRKNLLKWILLSLSFIGWIFLQVAIALLIKLIFGGGLKAYTPFTDSLGSFGYGVDLYFIPYLYLTIYGFLKEQSAILQ